MVFMHPICLAISICSAFAYSVMLKGKGAVKTNLIYMLPMLLLMALINPAFNHAGITVLAYLPDGNPLTLESVAYGISAAIMLLSVICWFSCYNQVMTEDKFTYLFGRTAPALSLIFSMTLGFIPKFTKQLKEVTRTQRLLGRDISSGSIIRRIKNAIAILSIMMSWALENSIETADSMKARGYGLPGRSAFSIFVFDKRDKKVLLLILVLGIYTIACAITGSMRFEYFPFIDATQIDSFSISAFATYFALCTCPITIEIWEVRKWRT